jgi:hypothetical protein
MIARVKQGTRDRNPPPTHARLKVRNWGQSRVAAEARVIAPIEISTTITSWRGLGDSAALEREHCRGSYQQQQRNEARKRDGRDHCRGALTHTASCWAGDEAPMD